MKKKLLVISFIEGGSLMAVELLGAKLFQPFYGQSLYVWSAVLAVTVGSLSLGYAYGARLSKKKISLLQLLKYSLFFAGLFILALPMLSSFIQAMTIGLPLQVGIILSAIVIMGPPVIAFGTVTPLIVQVMTEKVEDAGSWAGLFYFVSTLGGVLYTFLFGFYLIPTLGIKLCLFGLAISLIFLGLLVHLGMPKMNRSLLAFTVSILFIGSCSNPTYKTNTTTIEGTIAKAKFAKIFVSRYDALGNSETIDTFELNDEGSFKREYASVNKTMYFLKNSVNSKTIPLYVHKDENINLRCQFRDFENVKIVNPSVENQMVRKFRSKFKVFLADYLRVKDLISKEDITKKLAEYTNDGIDLEKKYDLTYHAMKSYVREFSDTCSISDIASLASLELGKEDYHFIQGVVDTMNVTNTTQVLRNKVQFIRSNLDLIQSSQLLSVKSFTDIRGKEFKLTDSDTNTVVFVWASYCHESKRYINEGFGKLMADYSNTDVRFISISLDESLSKLEQSIDDFNLDVGFHYCDLQGWRSPILSLIPTNYLPSVYVFDKKGEIVTINTTEKELKVLLENLK